MDWRRVDRWGRGIGDHGIEDIDVPLDTSDSGVLSSPGSADANTAIVLVPIARAGSWMYGRPCSSSSSCASPLLNLHQILITTRALQ